MNSNELCNKIREYSDKFRCEEAQWYQGDNCWDAENEYIVFMLKDNDGVEFKSIKELKVFRQEGNVR